MTGTFLSKQSKSPLPLKSHLNPQPNSSLKKNKGKANSRNCNKENKSNFREIVLSLAGQPVLIMRHSFIMKTPTAQTYLMEAALTPVKWTYLIILIPTLICSPVAALKPTEARSIVLEIKINRYMQISFPPNVWETASTSPQLLTII